MRLEKRDSNRSPLGQRRPTAIWVALSLACCAVRCFTAEGEFTRGMVVSGHPLATEAGLQVLKAGGNAVDAAVAVGLTLGVVDPKNSGIGGGCLILLRTKEGAFAAIEGRETAPATATPALYLKNGKPDPALSQVGALASGVPGALAAYEYAARFFGTKKLADLILPGAKLAEDGFPVSEILAKTLDAEKADLVRFDESRRIFLPGNLPLKPGQLLKQPDLAATYRAIAGQGSDWFYRGPFARAAAQWMKENGGVLTVEDFDQYRVRLRPPVTTVYRGYEVVGFPPPSSGGVLVAEILGMLERFDLASMTEGKRLHVVAEAMKLGFADRAYWLGDPQFTGVPRGLTSKDYAAHLAAKINLNKAVKVTGHGTPPHVDKELYERHTTHFCVADASGTWVACTATLNTSFGSKVVIPGTGVLMNNQMDDFSLASETTNYFGLLGSKANEVAGAKRPLSSMAPTFVLKDGKPILALGAAGGPKIISQVVLELVSVLDLGRNIQQAVAAPRIHHQWFPDELYVDPGWSAKVRDELGSFGHRVVPAQFPGVSHALQWSGKSFMGAPDPSGEGRASGW